MQIGFAFAISKHGYQIGTWPAVVLILGASALTPRTPWKMWGMDSFELSPFVRRPVQERSRAALASIIAAASEVLARKGHEGFSMADIAEAAGIPVGNIYRRFAGKDSIVQAIALDSSLRLAELVRARLEGHRFASVCEVVVELATIMATISEQNEALMRVLFSYPMTNEAYLDLVLTGRRRVVALYKDAVSGFMQRLPLPQRDIVIGVSYHILSAAFVSKARGDDPTMLDISWSELAQEVAKAATGYLMGYLGDTM